MRKTVGRWCAVIRYNPSKLDLLDDVYMPRLILSKLLLKDNKGIRQALDNTLNEGKCNMIERYGISWVNLKNPMRTENTGFFIKTEAVESLETPYELELSFDSEFISEGCWSKDKGDVSIKVSRQGGTK